MAEPDRLRDLLAQAEAHIAPHVRMPGAEATRVALRRRVRRRAIAAAAAVVIAVAGLGFAAWSKEPVPHVDPIASASASGTPSADPSPSPAQEVGASPSPSVCDVPIKSLTFNNRVGSDGWDYFLVSYKIADDQALCPGGQLIETFVATARREGNRWRMETSSLVTFHKPGMTNGWSLGWDSWCGDDQEIWVLVGTNHINPIPQTWSTSPLPLWSPGKISGAIKIAKPPHDGCNKPTPSPAPSQSP